MRKVLFIDRDGTLNAEPPDFQVDSVEKLRFLPGVFRWLGKLAAERDYDLVMVSNQDGLGTESHPEENFRPVHELVLRTFAGEGVEFKDVFVDRTFERDNAPTRKPRTGMLTKYMDGSYDLKNSFTIGDRGTDVELARNLANRRSELARDRPFVRRDSRVSPLLQRPARSVGAGWPAIRIAPSPPPPGEGRGEGDVSRCRPPPEGKPSLHAVLARP